MKMSIINKNKKVYRCASAITLIALIITIIVLLILAGVVLNTVLGDEGIIRKSQVATQKTNYKSAKEIVQMKLLEIQADCVQQNKNYTIKEIATQMKDDEEILIEKYYEGPLASVKDGLGEIPSELTGIVVSVDSYESYRKYKFLIGNINEVEGVIKGVLEGEVSERTQEEDFKKLKEFEEQNFGQVLEETEKIEISYEKKSISEDGTEVNLLIIVTASQGIEEITKPDGTVINGEGQTKKAIDFTAKFDTDYKFKVKGKGGTIKEIIINVNNTTDDSQKSDLSEYLVDEWKLENSLDNSKQDRKSLKILKGESEDLSYGIDGIHLENTVLSTEENYVFPEEFTLSYQYKPTSFTGVSIIVGKMGTFTNTYGHNGLIWWKETHMAFYNGKKLAYMDDIWIPKINETYNISYIYDGNIFYLYVNGELLTELEGYTNITDVLSIGGQSNSGTLSAGYQTGYANGYYKNIRIYNKALNIEQINN